MITLQGGPADGREITESEEPAVIRIPTSVDLQGTIMTAPVDADALYTDEGEYLGLEFLPRTTELVLPPDWATRHEPDLEPEPAI